MFLQLSILLQLHYIYTWTFKLIDGKLLPFLFIKPKLIINISKFLSIPTINLINNIVASDVDCWSFSSAMFSIIISDTD